MTKEQLAQKLLSYQQFMAKYIVDAQMQKTKAVVAAENAIKQKYEEKVKLLTGSTSIAETTIVTTATVESSPAFQQRSAKVSAAAAAGKSRWGDLENEKASHVVGTINGSVRVKEIPTPTTLALAPPMAGASSFNQRNAMVAAAGRAGKSRWGEMEVERATQAATLLSGSSTPLSVPPTFTTVPPEVEAADHGLRADGGVGGPSLAERVNFGAQLLQGSVASLVPDLLGSTLAPASSASSSYYGKRNSMIVAAGLAGKSRWGEMEIIKAKRLIASLPATSTDASVKVTQEIEAADHGLRADGGVGGPSLAQRVNFGAALLGQ